MAISRVSGNQIATSTQALITTLKFFNTNSVLELPTGTTAQRPTGVSIGTLRFNSTIDQAEIYKADDGTGSAGWSPVAGGGPAIGTDSIIRTNHNQIAENLTVGPTANNGAEFTNGMSAGPISINSGFTVTVESGAAWSVR
tara:strand:- start:188 stop:610 length:423 start_codon:yes stop_codon:yes gene_type:complete